MRKVLLTATVQSHICQFHKPLVDVLHRMGYEVHVAAKNNLAEKNGLKLDFVDKVFDIHFSRSPLNIDNIKAYRELKNIISQNSYDIIHCNTPMGGVISRLVALNFKNIKVIYTSHGFHFYNGASILSWCIYFPIELVLGKLFTDKLITISDEDFSLAKKFNMCKNIYRIHSVGINEEKYHVYTNSDIEKFISQHNLFKNRYVCICTGELNKNKRQMEVINAVPKIIKQVPNFLLLLAGNGYMKNSLEARISELGINDYVKLIGYTADLQDYVMISKIAISASKREGLGLNLLEAMACGKPVIGSINRGHAEFIKNDINGYIIKNEILSDGIADKVIDLALNEDLYKKLSINALLTSENYKCSNVKKELREIYEK